jgi:hypothetical protein
MEETSQEHRLTQPQLTWATYPPIFIAMGLDWLKLVIAWV